jgi:hypothetical protein
MEDSARMFPENAAPVPTVAELPTCQKMFEVFAPLMSNTLLPVAVVSALPTWKMNWALGLFWASSVTVPVIPIEELMV